jgi:hypothetical protein
MAFCPAYRIMRTIGKFIQDGYGAGSNQHRYQLAKRRTMASIQTRIFADITILTE